VLHYYHKGTKVSISAAAATIGSVAKIVVAPLIGLMLYIWNRHVKSNEREFSSVREKLDNYQERMSDMGIKVSGDYMRLKKDIEEYKEKQHTEIKEKMSEDKRDIMIAIKDNGSNINKLFELFNDHKLTTENRLTKIETIILKD